MRARATRMIVRGLLVSLVLAEMAYAQTQAGPVYMESYSGETAFPLSPEIDRLGAGGVYGGPGTTIQPDGILGQATDDFAVTFVASEEIALPGPFAIVGRFDDFAPFAALGIAATGVVRTSDGHQLAALVIQLFNGASILQVNEIIGGNTNCCIRQVLLPFPVSGPFDLELSIDPTGSGSAVARIRIDGATIATDSLPLIDYGNPDLVIQDVGAIFGSVSARFLGLCVAGQPGAKACHVLNEHLNPGR